MRMIEGFGGPFEGLLVYVWRRHLAAAVARMEALGAREEDLHTTQLTVGFADIVGVHRACPTSSPRSGSATSSSSSRRAAPTWSPPTAAG